MPNSRNYCFHGSGHIIRKGGQELGLDRPWNMFPETQSNYPHDVHHAKTSFVWKGFCTNANDYFSPEWDGADFRVLHELFLFLRSQDHLRSLSLLGTSGLWRKNPPQTRRYTTKKKILHLQTRKCSSTRWPFSFSWCWVHLPNEWRYQTSHPVKVSSPSPMVTSFLAKA